MTMAAGLSEREPDAVTMFVGRFAAMMTEAGVPRMAARVFVTLLCTDSGRLTASELMERLQASSGGISGAVRYLFQMGMIDREREPGSRMDHYRVRDDVWHEMTIRRDRMLGRWEATLREGLLTVGEGTPAGARLGETLAFFSFMQRELPALLDRWREYRAELPSTRSEPGV